MMNSREIHLYNNDTKHHQQQQQRQKKQWNTLIMFKTDCLLVWILTNKLGGNNHDTRIKKKVQEIYVQEMS